MAEKRVPTTSKVQELVEAAVESQISRNIAFQHIDGFNKEGQGTIDIQQGSFRVTNNAGQACYGGKLMHTFGGTRLSFDEKHEFLARVNFEIRSGFAFYWTMGQIKTSGYKWFGFYIDGVYAKGQNSDGSSITETNLWTYGATVWVKEVLKAILYPAEKIEFYRNGSLVGTSITNIPSGDYPEGAPYAYCMLAALQGGTAEQNIVNSWLVRKAAYTETAV